MTTIRTLPPPEYTEDEKNALIDFVLAMRKTHVQGFFRDVKLPRSGTKTDLRERLRTALDEGSVTYEQATGFLDAHSPWGKQHVFLYTGPRGELKEWNDPDLLLPHLKNHRVGKYFNARLPLILPEKLTLSSIAHLDGKLRITAVQKREYQERAPEHDDAKKTKDGRPVKLKAYIDHVTRTLVTFEWDLPSNTAMLQVTQLHGDRIYEQVRKEFFGLVGDWIDIEKLFGLVDIRRVVNRLHELERSEHPEARSHGYQYSSPEGTRVGARSRSSRHSVIREAFVDDALEAIQKESVGHLGNFYWLPDAPPALDGNPLTDEVHVILVADKSRINFPTPNSEPVVRYVLHRVRAHS